MSMGPPPFQTFLDDHRDDVYRFLVASVGRQEAEDCFQETFLAALRSYPRVQNSNLRSWVLTIAHRKAIDAHRSRGRRPAPVAELPEATATPPEDGDAGLWEAVRVLPPKQRTSVTLRFANDLSYGEISHVLHCSEEAARKNVNEGVKKLREGWNR